METGQKPGKKVLLGEILLEQGLVTKEQLDQALRVQVGGMRRLGSILVGMKVLRVENLTDALAHQLHLPVVKIEDEYRPEVKGVLPRYLCRKYSVLPLSREANNVLRLAMADPLDGVAVADVENFTGSVVQPVLARLSDIEQEIPARVAFSKVDIFNPEMYRLFSRGAAAALVVLVVALGWQMYRAYELEKWGYEKVTDKGTRVYWNHDLTIEQATNGTVNFSGRGQYASGRYGVSFDNEDKQKSARDGLSAFVKARDSDFNDAQREWIRLILENKLKASGQPLLAKNG